MHKKLPITFVKLGGAVISNKEVAGEVRIEVMRRLIQEFKTAWLKQDQHLVLGNGAGSFAHFPAAKYQTKQGFIHDDSRLGMAITQDSAARLNRIVVSELLRVLIPAVSLSPGNIVVTRKNHATSFYVDVLEEYVRQGLVPVMHGDVLVDQAQGCTVWSTDSVFSFFAQQCLMRSWTVKKIIHVTEAEGVWKNDAHDIYEKITPDMLNEVKSKMVDTRGCDVTGGMWHKIEEAMSLTKLGIKTQIISGLREGALTQALAGDTTCGTLITSV